MASPVLIRFSGNQETIGFVNPGFECDRPRGRVGLFLMGGDVHNGLVSRLGIQLAVK